MAGHTAATDDPAAGLAWPHRLVREIVGAAPETAHAAVDRLVAWAEAQRVRLLGALREAGRSPMELLHGEATHATMAALARAERRAATLASFPTFLSALERGEISAAHVDRLSEAFRRLLPPEREQMAADHERLLLVAAAGPAGRFGRFLAREVAGHEQRRLLTGGGRSDVHPSPAEARFAAQQAAVRLTSHVDRETGMSTHRLVLDPFRSLCFERRLAAVVEVLHHGPPIPGCPDDPLERQAFLRAQAFLRLLEATSSDGRSPGAEVIVVIDHTTPDGEPDIDWGQPLDLPRRVLDELVRHPATTVHEVRVRDGVVVSAPGALQLGRSTRLANRAQRRALRALYRGCCIPGCDVTFDRCTIHHVRWWRRLGCTDLDNLVPICTRHHHLVHDRGWELRLGPNRELRVTTASGRVMNTGPPHRWAA